jgi:hypothetical protein
MFQIKDVVLNSPTARRRRKTVNISDIAQRIELAVPAAFANFKVNGKSERTRTALTTFGELGHELGFAVCCKRGCYAKADNCEWLYDQLWYANHPTKTGYLVRIPMALESEFSNTEPHIDGDFQKILLVRADVRVWLWQSLAARKHIDLYKDQIKEFSYSLPGDEWVFGVYDWPLNQIVVERFRSS